MLMTIFRILAILFTAYMFLHVIAYPFVSTKDPGLPVTIKPIVFVPPIILWLATLICYLLKI